MKYFLVTVIVVLVLFGLLYKLGDGRRDETPVTGLPWQIERLPDGATRVFGITPGRTTLTEASNSLGDAMELAIIAAPGEAGTLEAYYRYYSAGPITGSLILVMDVADDTLAGMRARAQQDAGTRRYLLHPDDLPLARRTAVRYITFLPTLNLDADIARARFGEPGEIVEIDARQQHWLYPELGLDFMLDTEGKDLLQYLSPQAFAVHRERLRQTPDTER